MKRFLSLMVAVVFALTCFGTVMAAEKAAPAKAAPAMDNTMKKEGEAPKAEKKKATKKATKKKASKKAKAAEKKAEEPAPTAPAAPPAAPPAKK